MPRIDRLNILGVAVSAIGPALALATIESWIATRDPHYVCVTGVPGVIESQSDPKLRAIHNRAGLVTPDGMPLVWIGRLSGQQQMARVYGPDLLLALCEHSCQTGYRHYFFGGGEGVADLLVQELAQRFPGLQTVGTHSPPFRSLTPSEDAAIVEAINSSGADIVWVGLSTPKQERWMASHRDRLTAPVLIGVGAAFDFHAGLKPQAPYWMQRSGLEWLFRLLSEPRRLWKRYLYNNPRFVALVLLQLLGLRRFPIEDGPARPD